MLVALAATVGRGPLRARLFLGGAAPLIGEVEPVLSPRLLVAAAVGAGVVACGPVVADRLRFRALVVVAWLVSGAYAVALAAIDGASAVARPLEGRFEYRAVLPEIERVGVGAFVEGFVERLPSYPTHVRGHPVGAPLVFWLHEQLGLRGPGWSAALAIVAGTSVVVSVAVVIRAFAGEAVARRAVPFLVLTPSVLWVATSADALFSAVIAASIALFALAAHGGGPWADLLAVAAGALGAIALHLTYGAAVMLLGGAVVVLAARRVRPLLVGCIGAAAVTAGFAAAGFWWFDGLAATRVEYVAGAGGVRPIAYFLLLGNPAAFALALGPAVVVAVARLRDARLWAVAGGALVAALVADLSGMSKGEVERIWLPLVPWVTAACAVLPSIRWWLSAQVGLALVLQAVVDSPW